MISNIAPVTPAVPAEMSILGLVSSPDSTSSFADQLASAVNQAGSNPATPSQISDTPAGTLTGAPGSTPVQYSFFQYLMDTPPAAATAAPAANTASAALTPAAGTQPSGASESSSADPGWLSPPYYTPPAPTFVSWENPPGVMNTTASPETDLQNLAAQFINDPTQFVWGGVPATSPQELVDNFVSYAQSRAAAYPEATPAGYDPVAMGTKYANLVMDSIQKIPYDTIGSSPYASVYDAWAAGVNTFPGGGGTTSGTGSGTGSTVS
jgi:hypothetical protein